MLFLRISLGLLIVNCQNVLLQFHENVPGLLYQTSSKYDNTANSCITAHNFQVGFNLTEDSLNMSDIPGQSVLWVIIDG